MANPPPPQPSGKPSQSAGKPGGPASKPSAVSPLSSPAARRGFMVETSAVVIGGIVGLVPALSGLAVFLDPLRRKASTEKLLRVTTLDALPDDGIPRQFPVIAEHIDAWNRSLEPVGAVYLRRNKGEATPQCLTATCPHAGCFVNYDAPTNSFKCPCHNSTFTVDGQIIEPSPSPRAMDTLECEVKDQEILVKFQNYYTGKTEKVVKE
jgi:menaquinol-cytochrome c reductase iron-sulfur subunit